MTTEQLFVTFGLEMNVVTDASGTPVDIYHNVPLDIHPALEDIDDLDWNIDDEEDEDDEDDFDSNEYGLTSSGGDDGNGDDDFYSAVNVNFD